MTSTSHKPDIATLVVPPQEEDGAKAAGEKPSVATELINMAKNKYTFGVSTISEAYAVPKDGPKVVSTLRGSKLSLRQKLCRQYFDEHQKAASSQALKDALQTIEGYAMEEPEKELYLRVAKTDDGLWLDLGDDTGRAIHITKGGWSIEYNPPVLFKRTALTGSLPEPIRGGDLNGLWTHMNVDQNDRPLLIALLLSALNPDISHPVVALFGEQGTGKTTAQKLLIGVIDPGPVPARKPPRNEESWVTSAAASLMVGLDNLSVIPDWLSDSICRASSGDGDIRRKLYTDDELAVFSYRRCIFLNGIDPGALRGDLSERMLMIRMLPIDDKDRVLENEIWPKWKANHACVLGGFLDLAVKCLTITPNIKLKSKPRMADFAMILAAVDEALGTAGLPHYLLQQTTLAADSLGGDSFTSELAQMEKSFRGTSAALLLLFEAPTDHRAKGWPKTSRAVTQRVRRAAPALRKLGWEVSDDNAKNRSKALRWTMIPPGADDPTDEGAEQLTDDERRY